MSAEQAARRWRERRIARSRRDVELETFPTTGGSLSKNAHPMFGERRPGGYPPQPRDSTAASSTGETITVDADSVAVSTTPTVVSFTGEVGERAGFLFVSPSDEIQPTFGQAYYDVQVSIDRGGYAGTLAVEILRGDQVVWGPTFDSYWSNPQVPVTAKGRLVDPAISPWRVRLTGSEAGTVTRVVAQVELVDRPRVLIPNSAATPPDTIALNGDGRLTLSSGGWSPDVTVPGGAAVVGDVLVATFSVLYDTGSVSAPTFSPDTGWTLVVDEQTPVGVDRVHVARVWWKIATAGDVDAVLTGSTNGGPMREGSFRVGWFEGFSPAGFVDASFVVLDVLNAGTLTLPPAGSDPGGRNDLLIGTSRDTTAALLAGSSTNLEAYNGSAVDDSFEFGFYGVASSAADTVQIVLDSSEALDYFGYGIRLRFDDPDG